MTASVKTIVNHDLLPFKKRIIKLDRDARLQSVINETVDFSLLKKMNSDIMTFNSSGKAKFLYSVFKPTRKDVQ